MSVVIETTLGDITVDLFLSERPRACLNFLKLCKIKYYNYNLFHTISRGFIAQTGDPTGSRNGGESIFGILDGKLKTFFEGENEPRMKHTKMGLISFVGNQERMIGSQFFLTLGEDLAYLDEKHCVFGEVVEGFDILEMINEVICDTDERPYQDVRITHTVILDDPYPDPNRLVVPSRSPSPSAERLQGGRIAPDEEIDEMEGKLPAVIAEIQADKEAKARATILEMVGDLPDADMAPPENVLFVCKLNPVTNDDDLEIIFSRFGKIKSCEVIRDKKTGDSLQYAFVEFEDQKSCENAYFKMDNVLIDDRRIHVDFSQSVSKIRWHGKGRGVTHYDDKGKKSKDDNNDIGRGNYKNKRQDTYYSKNNSRESNKSPKRIKDRSLSPRDQDNSKRVRDNFASLSESKNKSRNERDGSLSPRGQDNSRMVKHNSQSLSEGKNKSRNEREKMSFLKKNNKEFISFERSGSRNSRENNKERGKNENRSRKNNNKSVSPKRNFTSPPRKDRYYSKSSGRNNDRSRSPKTDKYKSKYGREKSATPKKDWNISSSSERNESRYYTEHLKRYREQSNPPKRDSNRKNNSIRSETSTHNKTVASSSRIVSYNERKTKYTQVIDRNKLKLKRKSSSEIDSKKRTKKKKNNNSSDDSDSDESTKKMKKCSSSSSDSDYYQKKKFKKNKIGKKKKYSSSDSEDYKKSNSKKKKKKKHESD